MTRVFNFSAGPATLPESVLLQAQAEMLDWNGVGASIVEISHRSADFIAVAAEAEADLRALVGIPDDYAVLFLSGGATTQQALLALNFVAPGETIDYVVTGHWGKTAIKQVLPYANVNIAADGEPDGFRSIPARDTWKLTPGAAYVHITANETIHGVEFRDTPEVGAAPLFADFSSSIASEPIDVSKYGVIYAGAQKNLGPVGVAVVIIRRDLLERSGQPRADIFDYRSHAARDSMLNTPPTWNWYLAGLVFKWMLAQGGVEEFARRSAIKSELVYGAIDASGGFYRNEVVPAARSRMNIPYFLRDETLTARFVAESKAAGLIALKGHKAVGGIRASLYNALPVVAAQALVDFMRDFQLLQTRHIEKTDDTMASKPKKPATKVAKTTTKPTTAAAPVLADVRAHIDGIDRQIQGLIADRAAYALQVGKAKGKLAAAVDYYRPEREAQVLRMVVDRNEGPLSDEVLVHVFREIMSACLAQQEPLKVGFLGPEGTFSQQAVMKHFGRSAHGLPLASIEEVFQEVENGNADFGVVPVENSGQGTIQVTLDMFLTSNLKICGEVELRVHQYLLSRTGRIEDIERIYSHPQSFAQTSSWLRSNLPKVEKIPVSSNAEGARRARNSEDAASIGGESAGHVYGLKKVVMSPIQDEADNTTRFLVIGRSIFPTSGHDRTSVLVFIHDKPGALFDVLSPFAKHGISMNRIESRPSHHAKWEYGFFIDLAGHIEDESMKKALAELKAHSAQIKVLGSYPVAVP